MLTHQNWNYDSYDYYCFKSVPSRAKEYCWPVQCLHSIYKQASIVQSLDSAIHHMNHRPADKYQGNHIALSTKLISVLLGQIGYINGGCPSCPKKTACCVIIYEFSDGSANPECKRRVQNRWGTRSRRSSYRSIRTGQRALFCSMHFCCICLTTNIMSTVLHLGLKPPCASGRLLSETVISRFRRMQAKIFPATERSEMPLQFPQQDLFPLFLQRISVKETNCVIQWMALSTEHLRPDV